MCNVLLQKNWAGFIWSLSSQTFHTASSSNWVEIFSVKIFYCIVTAFYTSHQWNSNTVLLISGKETAFYVEIQNLCMLNAQASSLELWTHTVFRWLWSSCFEYWPPYRGMHIHLGKSQVTHDPFLILEWNDWFWLQGVIWSKMPYSHKTARVSICNRSAVSNPRDGSELWPCKPFSGDGKLLAVSLTSICTYIITFPGFIPLGIGLKDNSTFKILFVLKTWTKLCQVFPWWYILGIKRPMPALHWGHLQGGRRSVDAVGSSAIEDLPE